MGAGLDQNAGTEFQAKGGLISIGILTRTSNQTGTCVEQNGDANSHPGSFETEWGPRSKGGPQE